MNTERKSMKIKEKEKWNKFLNLARELNKPWNTNIKVISIGYRLYGNQT